MEFGVSWVWGSGDVAAVRCCRSVGLELEGLQVSVQNIPETGSGQVRVVANVLARRDLCLHVVDGFGSGSGCS